jgi:hypothetical protein
MTVHRLSGLLLAALFLPAPLLAQGYRGELRVRSDFIGFQGIERDSVASGSVSGSGLQRVLPDGTVATCIEGDYCRWYRSGDVSSVIPVYQDLKIVAWPGMEGVSFHAQLRGRLGSDDAWPRSDQEVEAITAYASFERADWWVRAGRLLRTGSLGYHNFDGASVAWRGLRTVTLEAYGGWSLGIGLNAPRDGDLLADADEFAPNDRGYILGGAATIQYDRRVSATVNYQREIRTDRASLFTERLAADARALFGGFSLDGSVTWDMVYKQVNLARAQATVPLPYGLRFAVEGRHYTPFFEYWTIWGAFMPVGYNEGRALVAWSVPGTALQLQAGGGYRDYESTNVGVSYAPVRDDGWRAFGSASYSWREWFADGGYRAETGFGASRYGGDLSIGRTVGPDARVSLFGSSTRTFGEFRYGEQTGSGGGVRGSWDVGDFTVHGSAALYRMSFTNRPQYDDWTQARGYLSVAWRFGSSPAPRTSMRGIGGY